MRRAGAAARLRVALRLGLVGLGLTGLGLAISAGPARASGGGGHEAPAAPAKPAPPPPPPPAAAAAPDDEQPWRLIRALHRLQARLGEGDAVAQAAQGDLVADLGRRFDAAPEAVWDDRRNAAAQMVLLFSGADPRAARRRLDKGLFGEHDAVVRAGLAFAEGDAEAPRRVLAALDDAPLDALPRAHAALAAATLIAAGPAADRAQAHPLFDRARLLAPGFLPEEAALRRQTRLAEAQSDRPRFAALAARYLRRYPGSVYAPPFRQRLPQAIAAMVAAPADLAPLASLLRALTAPERGAALDAVARAALAKGAPDLAGAAATLWLDAGADPAGAGRAQIYALAAQALRGGPEIAARLAESRPADADAEALRRAALALARQVAVWPPPPQTAGLAPPDAPQDKPTPEAAATEAKIRKALADGESLLRAAPRLAPSQDAPRQDPPSQDPPQRQAAPAPPARQGAAR